MSDPQFFSKGHDEDHPKEIDTNILLNTTSSHIEELCRTPTCRKNKIPIVGSFPPPAPKKPREVLLCKRKFPRFDEFFESSGNEELEKFFISCTELSRGLPKGTSTPRSNPSAATTVPNMVLDPTA
ncbi:hypothetical protein RND71_006610 [Anisodus tanguticus]|uniref:Uncharacterized protein n=1 Tax=Anisodus tanguticus TaxID=243964 RepID=A0AAE1SUI6_9SOLA|nr:hypothetical protein RND71_006610 [Anisodus tanguticus]